MKWPFISRRKHEDEVEDLKRQVNQLERAARYNTDKVLNNGSQ